MRCGGPSIQGGSYCKKHTRYPNRSGPTPYDHAYQQDRAKVLRGELVCHICGGGEDPTKGPFQADHVVPLSKGGAHTRANLRPAHRRCNISKGGANRSG